MKLKIKGGGTVSLTQKDFLSSGGQGNVYAKGNTAYKVYKDPKKMIPTAKIDELSVMTDANIIRPDKVLLDSRNKPVGYTMRYVRDVYSLCQLFPPAFKKRHKLDEKQILELVLFFRGLVEHTHSKGILIVDLNEMNYLVSHSFNEIYGIDVDSYQTPGFPATAIMESIRDRHVKNAQFSAVTDWFSWGIVTFQMWMGIHPYKGKHPSIKDMDARMLQNISVFNADVSVPKICPDVNAIPQAFRDWFRAVFEGGQRVPPPLDAQAVIVIHPVVKTVSGTDNFEIVMYSDLKHDIISYHWFDGQEAFMTTGGLFVHRNLDSKVPTNAHIGATPVLNHVVAVYLDKGHVVVYDATTKNNIPTILDGEAIMSYDGRFYVKKGLEMFELQFVEIGQTVQCSARVSGSVMEKASRIFDGVVMQDVVGAWYATLFPRANHCYQVKIDELKDYQIVAAKYDNNVLMVVASKQGVYDKFIFRFDETFTTYDVRIVEDVPMHEPNFVVLPNGICSHMTTEEKLELFLNRKDKPDTKVVEDPVLSGDMRLFHKGTKLMFARGSEVYTISMKK